MTFLEARQLGKSFPLPGRAKPGRASGGQKGDRVVALDEITFRLESGDALGVIGGNGSGKSTLLRLLAGASLPTNGSVTHEGRISTLLGLESGMVPELTGCENLFLLGRLLGRSKCAIRDRLDAIIDFSGLGDALDWPIRAYSNGMLLRLGFSAAVFLQDFDILLVDEVMAVGDYTFQKKCVSKLRKIRQESDTILVIATHNLGDIGSLCNRVMLLDDGRVSMQGETEAVLRHYWRDCERALSRLDGFENPLESPQVHGADLGTVRIERVSIVDGHGLPREKYRCGESLSIAIEYHALAEVRDPLFRVQIHRNDGSLVWGMNSYRRGLHIGALVGAGRMELMVHQLRLLQGEYYVSVGIWPDEYSSMVADRAYDFHERAYVISVESDIEQGAGIAHQDCEWCLRPAEEGSP